MARYSKESLYGVTQQINGALDVLKHRNIPKNQDDQSYIIQSQYNYRPDLLASDLYNNPDYWWVFKERNPSIIDDPIFDFVAGIEIKVPPLSTIKSVLGAV
jgi:hypothetical protein